MAIFGLVHGGQYGAWCWPALVGELEIRGHQGVAIDLRCNEELDISDYASIVAGQLRNFGSDVILVGHSLGGATIPVVASVIPVRRMVFLSAAPPEPGRTMIETMAGHPDFYSSHMSTLMHTSDARGRLVPPSDPQVVHDAFFHDCSADIASWARSQLRPQSQAPIRQACPISSWPNVPSSMILCEEDRQVNPSWVRRVCRQMFGEDALELPGSHSPFLSRPRQLAEMLVAVSGKST